MGLFDWMKRRRERPEETPSLRRLCMDLEVDMARERREMEVMRSDLRRMIAKITKRVERSEGEPDSSIQDAPGSINGGEGILHPAEIFRRNQLGRRR